MKKYFIDCFLWTKRECQSVSPTTTFRVYSAAGIGLLLFANKRATHKDFTISVIFSDFRRLSHLPLTSVLHDD